MRSEWARRMEREREPYEDFVLDLDEALQASERALNALYSLSGPKRGIWYRFRLRRAQNALMRLYMQEVNAKESK